MPRAPWTRCCWRHRREERLGVRVVRAAVQDVGRRDPQDVAHADEAQALGHEDDVESLIPGHRFELDGNRAPHTRLNDDVQTADA